MNKAAIVAAIVAGDETYEGIDLRPGRRFAAGVEEESHKDVRFNNAPDTCVACDSDFPRGVCFRLAAEQWVDEYMPRPRGRPVKAARDQRRPRSLYLTDAEYDTLQARMPPGEEFSEWARRQLLSE